MKYLKQLIALVVLLASVNTIKAYDFEYEGIAYNILSATEMTCEVAFKEGGYAGEITIPETVEYMGRKLTVVSLEERCFSDCSLLTKANLPSSLSYAGDYCFNKCTSLKTVDLSQTQISRTGRYMFEDCSALTVVKLPEKLLYLNDGCFCKCVSLKEIEIPKNVTGLGVNCFHNCKSLTSIVLPNSINEIESSCFSGCSSLASLTPGLCGVIGSNVISGCTSLKSLTYFGPLYYCALDGASLTSLTLTNPKNIWTNSFRNLPLKELIIADGGEPYKVLEVPDVYSIHLDLLETIYIGRESSNEYDCAIHIPNVKYITLGKNIRSLKNDGIFYYSNCENLVRIQCNSTIPPSLDYFSGNDFSQGQYASVEVLVPDEAVDAYKGTNGWKNFWNIKGISQSGVDDIAADNSDKVEIGRFDTFGRPVTENYNGIIIIRYSDGSTEKQYTVQ